MAFNISPQINIFERDFTLTLEMKGDTKGAQSGSTSWGPAFVPTLITSGEEGLRGKYGIPTDQNYLSYFIARDFLKYSNKLLFNRVCGPLARNSIAGGGGVGGCGVGATSVFGWFNVEFWGFQDSVDVTVNGVTKVYEQILDAPNFDDWFNQNFTEAVCDSGDTLTFILAGGEEQAMISMTSSAANPVLPSGFLGDNTSGKITGKTISFCLKSDCTLSSTWSYTPSVTLADTSESFVLSYQVELAGNVNADDQIIVSGAEITSIYGSISAVAIARFLFLNGPRDLMLKHNIREYFEYTPGLSPTDSLDPGVPIVLTGRPTSYVEENGDFRAAQVPIKLTLKLATNLVAGQRDYVLEQFGGPVVVRSCVMRTQIIG